MILTHRKPDGDTLGSAAALCLGLRQLGKRAHVLQNPEVTPQLAPLMEGITKPAPEEGDLLVAVDALPGIGRVRLGSLDPSLIKPRFVDKIANLKSLAPHFHLSLQSGCSRTLAAMKRKYNAEQAMAALELLRARIPGVQFTTDVIVGFPGESEQDFEQTLDFIRRARFLQIHAFPYSGRKNTPAIRMPGQVPMQIRRERVHILQSVQAEVRDALMAEMIGCDKSVLFETDRDGESTGHTPEFIEVTVSSDRPLCGKTLRVHLTEATADGCRGELID